MLRNKLELFLDPFLYSFFSFRVVFHGEISFNNRNMTELMIKEGVIAFIGPDETCLHEALVASAWNLPLISYVNSIFLGLKDLFSWYRTCGLVAFHSKISCILILHLVHSVTFIYPLVLCWHKAHQQDALSYIRTDFSWTAWENIQKRYRSTESLQLEEIHRCRRFEAVDEGDHARC